MWFSREKILPFNETCIFALTIAMRLAIKEESNKINALHFLKGIIHCGDERIASIFNRLDLNYNDDVNGACDITDEHVARLLTIISCDNDVKKILARGNSCANKRNKKEISALDVLVGIVEESPAVVRSDLKEQGINLSTVGEMSAEEAL